MKSIANRLFVVVAVALSLGTFAYGQTTLKADVPFAFAVPGGPAQAGQYTVEIKDLAGSKIVQISSNETGRSVLALPHRLVAPVNGVIAPRLVFRCGEEGCHLSEIWTLNGGYSIPAGHGRNPEYLASIPLTVFAN
jgi:hypothetical protein